MFTEAHSGQKSSIYWEHYQKAKAKVVFSISFSGHVKTSEGMVARPILLVFFNNRLLVVEPRDHAKLGHRGSSSDL